MEILATLDPEILSHIETLKPFWEKQAAPEVINKLLAGLDPDLALEMFLEDQLDAWMRNEISTGVVKHDSPAKLDSEEVTVETVRKYISKRYPRLLEYAEYHTGLAKWSEEATDVLHEAILSTLLLPEEKLISLFMKKKKDQGLCELDFYLLRIIKLSCHSVNSPYYWRYHKRAIRDENTEISRINDNGRIDDEKILNKDFEPEIIADVQEDDEVESGYSDPEADYDQQDIQELICVRFRLLRDVLEKLDIPEVDKDIFRWKFMLEESWISWRGKERTRKLQETFKRVKFMVIDEIQKLKNESILKSIHDLFLQAKSLKVPITEAEFLLLRKWLSENKQCAPSEELKVITAFEKRLLFLFSEQLEAFSINHKF